MWGAFEICNRQRAYADETPSSDWVGCPKQRNTRTNAMKHADCNGELTGSPSLAPSHWAASYTHLECSLHQLSPYIGKLKSVIARDLITRYSEPGQLVADMFCGSGTVPLEAARLGRRVFASDTSLYAITLTKGKLNPPESTALATEAVGKLLNKAAALPTPDLRRVPWWVRAFFHPRTLKEVLSFVEVLKGERHYFLLASLLGILHHQRPGFLSYPSSHLVPYLRSRKFPKAVYPELYEYRPLLPRLEAKIHRALKRPPQASLASLVCEVRRSSAESVNLPTKIDCVVTSPPYMNALDYHRDNRLRLWFLGETSDIRTERTFASFAKFRRLLTALAEQLDDKMRPGGHCVFMVGDQTFRGGEGYPSDVLAASFLATGCRFRLVEVIADVIPDVRRSRRHLAGVKRENVLVFRKD